ncbi:MAG: hypothetical protein IKY09_02425 [Methanocorpusculum sp.]|nr:hypothetical protein [Methanocorpusculum sp.]
MKKSFAVIISLLLLSTVFLSGCVSTGGDGDFEIWVNEEPFEYEGSMCDILYVFTTDGVGLELWADAGGEYFFEYYEFIWEDDGTTDVKSIRSINHGSMEDYRNRIQTNINKYYINKWFHG